MTAPFEAAAAPIAFIFSVINQRLSSVNLPVKRIFLRSTAEAFRQTREKEADPENEDRGRLWSMAYESTQPVSRVTAATGRRLASRAWFDTGVAVNLI